jgi:hypothetical protein
MTPETVKPEQAIVDRQWLNIYVSPETGMQATIKKLLEVAFSIRSVQRLSDIFHGGKSILIPIL